MCTVRRLAPIAVIVMLLIGLGVTAVIMTSQVSATSRRLQTEHAEQRPTALANSMSQVLAQEDAWLRQIETSLPPWSRTPNRSSNVASLTAITAQFRLVGSMELYTKDGQFLAAAGDRSLASRQGDVSLGKVLAEAQKNAWNAMIVDRPVGGKTIITSIKPSARDEDLIFVVRYPADRTGFLPAMIGYAVDTKAHFTLTDAFGTVVGSSLPGIEGTRFPAATDARTRARNRGLFTFELDGVPTVGVVREAGVGGWFVVYTQDARSFNGGIDSASRRIIVVLIFIMVATAAAVGVFWYRRQRAVAAGGERLSELLANVNDAVLVVQDGRITYANPALETLVGVPASAAIGRALTDVLGTTGATILSQLMAATSGHKRPITVGDVPCHAEGRDVVWTEATVAARHQSGSIRGSVISLHDISHRRQTSEALLHEASHDQLTGLANRAKFMAETGQAMVESRRTESPLAVLFLDLDGFKTVNDEHGHSAGDLVLTEIADRLAEVLRGGDLAARLGGDEFAVLLKPISDVGQATEVAERIIDAINQPIAYAGGNLYVGVSIGIAVANPHDKGTSEALLRDADLAMYGAKESGKNTRRVAQSDITQPVVPVQTRRVTATAGTNGPGEASTTSGSPG